MAISRPFCGSAWCRALVILIASQFLRAPPVTASGHCAAAQSCKRRAASRRWRRLKTPLFWVLYVMFVLVASGGLIVTAQFASIAADFGVAESLAVDCWASPARC